MLQKSDLTNKCGSCCYFKAIEETTQGECLQNPYGEDVVHDPEHPYWIVQRSRIKCRLYNTKPQTNADRIRAMSDEELADFLNKGVEERFCKNLEECAIALDQEKEIPAGKCRQCVLAWLQQSAQI